MAPFSNANGGTRLTLQQSALVAAVGTVQRDERYSVGIVCMGNKQGTGRTLHLVCQHFTDGALMSLKAFDLEVACDPAR